MGTVRHRIRVPHNLLPLKCCYSPSGQGYLVSGSENKDVYICSLAKGANYRTQYLTRHTVPVVAVAVNLQDSLLASSTLWATSFCGGGWISHTCPTDLMRLVQNTHTHTQRINSLSRPSNGGSCGAPHGPTAERPLLGFSLDSDGTSMVHVYARATG